MIYVLSGGTKLFAAIGVTYPEGSTVTCTNGTKTLKAKNTSGQWVFAIPEAGTWTVTATQGTNTKSQSVSITTEGQFESVELSYALVLFANGTKNVEFVDGGEGPTHTSDWATNLVLSVGTTAAQGTAAQYAYTKNVQPTAERSKILVKYTDAYGVAGQSTFLVVGISDAAAPALSTSGEISSVVTVSRIALTNAAASGTIEVDISNVGKNCRVVVGISNNSYGSSGNKSSTATITECLLA